MSALKEVWIKRTKLTNGFSGICSLVDNFGDQVCIIAANEDVLFEQLKKLLPDMNITGTRFQKVTVIHSEAGE